MPTKNIGALNVRITASSADLRRELDRSIGAVNGFARRIGDIVGGAAIAGAIGFRIRQALGDQVRQFNEISDAANRLGTTTEALTALQFAVESVTGNSAQVTSGIERMLKAVSEAAQGAGEAAQSFRDLGISASDIIKLSPETMLHRIADAMVKVSSQADRVRIAADIFGRGNVDLIRIMEKGSAGLREMAVQAQRFGLIIDENARRRVNGLIDSLKSMQLRLSGVSREITARIAPALRIVVDAAIALMDVFRTLDRLTGGLLSGFALFVAGLLVVTIGVWALVAAIGALNIAMSTFFGAAFLTFLPGLLVGFGILKLMQFLVGLAAKAFGFGDFGKPAAPIAPSQTQRPVPALATVGDVPNVGFYSAAGFALQYNRVLAQARETDLLWQILGELKMQTGIMQIGRPNLRSIRDPHEASGRIY